MTSTLPSELGDSASPKASRSALALTGLAALGIVFGDIGTSPLYTLKTAFDYLHGDATPDRILGILSLVIWTLFLITSVKYVLVAMSIDNDGEGGILALMSLLGIKRRQRPAIVVAGLLGAALIYGDGAITPAISVLSALEGLDIAAPGLSPTSCPPRSPSWLRCSRSSRSAPRASAPRSGRSWRSGSLRSARSGCGASLSILGCCWRSTRSMACVFSPRNGFQGFLVLGGIFLCVTGAEALYADMGHFGKGPIRRAWSWIVFPCLVLNYAGQCAIALRGRVDREQHFLPAVPAGSC